MTKKEVPLIIAEKTSRKNVQLDPQGFFVIEIDRKEEIIRVEYYSNIYKGDKIVSGNLEKVFTGFKADSLSDTITKHISNLRQEHYMYLGRELQKAQIALEKKTKYVQGGC